MRHLEIEFQIKFLEYEGISNWVPKLDVRDVDEDNSTDILENDCEKPGQKRII